jgi:hypothetical protein
MGGYDQKGPEMAEEIRPFCEENLVNAIGGCCGSTPEHIAAIAGEWRLLWDCWLDCFVHADVHTIELRHVLAEEMNSAYLFTG